MINLPDQQANTDLVGKSSDNVRLCNVVHLLKLAPSNYLFLLFKKTNFADGLASSDSDPVEDPPPSAALLHTEALPVDETENKVSLYY